MVFRGFPPVVEKSETRGGGASNFWPDFGPFTYYKDLAKKRGGEFQNSGQILDHLLKDLAKKHYKIFRPPSAARSERSETRGGGGRGKPLIKWGGGGGGGEKPPGGGGGGGGKEIPPGV